MRYSLEEQKKMVQLGKYHLIDFADVVNPKYKAAPYHRIIANELENIEKNGDRDYKVLLIVLPPRHGKSELCSILFPAWYLGRNPDKEIITISYSGELAQDFGGKTRGLINDEAYKLIFNIKLKEDEQAKAKWKTDKGGSYTSTGVGGAITGRGANILLFDDPIKNREEAESEVYRNKVWSFFTSTAYTRLEPKGVIIVILTRWHIDDLAGRILENEELKNKCKVIHFPAIKDGKALWPERYDLNVLEGIRNTIGPYDFAALYQGSPILTEKQEFKPEWYKYITEEELERLNTNKYLTIDTALSKKDQADYCGFCDNEVDNQNFWNLKAWHTRMNADELIDMLFTLQAKRHYVSIGIEKTAYTDGLKPFLDSEQRKRNRFLPIKELKHNQAAKELRIRNLLPRYASGSIRHIKGQCATLEEEEFNFPFGKNDDVLDATAYQIQLANDFIDYYPVVPQPPKPNPAI
jgi:hypothetical protein